MSQTSYFYDGTTTGDASTYDDAAFVAFYDTFMGREGFVIPETLNNLDIAPTVGVNGSITVDTGSACFHGLYINDAAVNLALDSSAANNRIDSIILNYDSAAHTIRLAVVKGTEAAYPSAPALTSDQMLLAQVWIPSGWNAATTLVTAGNVRDKRHFIHIGETALKYVGKDFLPNGEWMFFSLSNAANPPDYWREVGTMSTCVNGGRLGEAVRGEGIAITCDANEGIETTVLVPGSGTRTFTLKGIIKCSNNPIYVELLPRTLGGAVGAGKIVTLYQRSAGGTAEEFILRLTIDSTYDAVDIKITASVNTSGWTVGQIMLIDGWVAGPFRQKSEWLFGSYLCTDASWALTAKSSGTTTINLNASFNTPTARGLRGIIGRLQARDSGSAGAGPYYLGLAYYNAPGLIAVDYCDYITNDTTQEAIAVVSVAWNDANMPFDAVVVASGALTLDARIYIIGIIS